MKKLLIIFAFLIFCFLVNLNAKNKDICFVNTDILRLRSKPSIESSVVANLSISSALMIIKEGPKETIYGMKGRWLLIKTIPGKTFFEEKAYNSAIKGWVFDPFITRLISFKKVQLFQKSYILKEVHGDKFIYYHISKDGKNKMCTKNGSNSKKECVDSTAYKSKNLIIMAEFFISFETEGIPMSMLNCFYLKNDKMCTNNTDETNSRKKCFNKVK